MLQCSLVFILKLELKYVMFNSLMKGKIQIEIGNSSAISKFQLRFSCVVSANVVGHSTTVTYQCEEKEWQAL